MALGIGQVAANTQAGVQAVTLSNVLASAGFTGYNMRQAEGVVWAESSAQPNASNPSPCSSSGDHAIGLFAICTNHCGEHGLPADKTACQRALENPYINARVAHGIWQDAGGTFNRDWTTMQNGSAFLHFGKDGIIGTASQGSSWLSDVARFVKGELTIGGDILNAPAAIGGAIGGAAASPITNTISTVAQFISAITNPSTWARVGKGLLGGVLVIVGVGAMVFVIATKASGSNAGKATAAASRVLAK